MPHLTTRDTARARRRSLAAARRHACAPTVAVTGHGRSPCPSTPLASWRTSLSASSPVSSLFVLLGAAGRRLFLSVDSGASASPSNLAMATIRPFAGDEHPLEQWIVQVYLFETWTGCQFLPHT